MCVCVSGNIRSQLAKIFSHDTTTFKSLHALTYVHKQTNNLDLSGGRNRWGEAPYSYFEQTYSNSYETGALILAIMVAIFRGKTAILHFECQ